MIKLCRVDHRLLHGQVAFSWSHALGADAILIVSDEVASNEVRMKTMRLAKPVGIKLVIKGVDDSIKAIKSGVTDKFACSSLPATLRMPRGWSASVAFPR